MVYKGWHVGTADAAKAAALSKTLGIGPLLADVLVCRGISEPKQALDFIAAADAPLGSPMLLHDIDKAVARIRKAIDSGEKIVVFGDYDVDGIAAAAIMFSYLENAGANVYYKLPAREDDGYGISLNILNSLASKGVTLIITVDTGIAAYNEVEHAKSLGIDFVITDHHKPPEKLPNACAVIDPLIEQDNSPFKKLCGAGVAFKVICALEECEPDELFEYYGDLVAIATVADVMELSGENRSIVKRGIELFSHIARPGLMALLELSSIKGKTLTSESIAYSLAPKINAAGRMGDATLALELLLCEDEQEAAELAADIEKLNTARQQIEQKITDAIVARVNADEALKTAPIMVLWGEDYHNGVIGIVCSRLVEMYGKPVVIISIDGEEGRGSGRSVSGISLYSALNHCSHLLTRFGGHELAAGLSVPLSNIEALRDELVQYITKAAEHFETEALEIDAKASFAALTPQSIEELQTIAPFGSGNTSPAFLFENAAVDALYPVQDGRHTRVRLKQGGATLYAMAFGQTPKQFAYKQGDAVDAVLNLSVYEGAGGKVVSARIKDIKPAGLDNAYIKSIEAYEAFRMGLEITKQQQALLLPSREHIGHVYRLLVQGGFNMQDLRPLFVKLPAAISAGCALMCIDVLKELELVCENEQCASQLATPAQQQKKDLSTSKLLAKLTVLAQ